MDSTAGVDRAGGERIRDTASAGSVVNTAGLAFLDTLHRWVQGGLSGGIEWQDEKRRRLVFVEGDTLLAVQSNLRSESMERVVETGAAADLISATRQVRLRGLFAATTGVILVHPGVEPPSREPVSLALALWEVADALPALDADHYPVAVPSGFGRLRSLPWSSELLQYLQELDGTREVQDVEDFAPEPGPVVSSALAIARLLGAVELSDGAATKASVKRKSAATERTSGFFDGPPTPEASHFALPDDIATEDLEQRLASAANHFEVLGVEWQAPPDTVRRAYVALAANLHPDRWAMAPADVRAGKEQMFDLVRAAWECLGEPKAREAYTRRVIFGELTEEEKAEKQLRAIFEAERLLTLAQRELGSQRYPQASELLRQALEQDPLHPQVRAYSAFATVKLNQGRSSPAVEDAVREVETVAREIPGAEWARVLLGKVRVARGDNAGAQRAFIEALKLNPSNPDATAEMWKLKGQRAEKEAPTGGLFARLFKR